VRFSFQSSSENESAFAFLVGRISFSSGFDVRRKMGEEKWDAVRIASRLAGLLGTTDGALANSSCFLLGRREETVFFKPGGCRVAFPEGW
jgi:hypothetical protein